MQFAEQARPKRATSETAVAHQQVRAALRTVALQLNVLHREAALLVVMAQHFRSDAPDRISRLRQAVAEATARFEEEVAGLPEHLKNHGRVTDLRKSLATLEAGLLAST